MFDSPARTAPFPERINFEGGSMHFTQFHIYLVKQGISEKCTQLPGAYNMQTLGRVVLGGVCMMTYCCCPWLTTRFFVFFFVKQLLQCGTNCAHSIASSGMLRPATLQNKLIQKRNGKSRAYKTASDTARKTAERELFYSFLETIRIAAIAIPIN